MEYNNEEVNDNKDVKVLVAKARKITTTTGNIIPKVGRPLTTLINLISPKDGQDMRVKKV